jgi:hypothetical protein
VANRQAKITEAKSGELKRMNYFTALHFYTNEAFKAQLSSGYTPTSMFGITANMPDDYLQHRDSKTRPYMSPEVELMFYIPLAFRMVNIEPAFHQFFTQVRIEKYVSPFKDGGRTLKRGMLTGNEVVDAIWMQIEEYWRNLQGQVNTTEGHLQRANLQVASMVGRKTIVSALGDKVGLKTTELAQKKPLAIPDPRITMSWGKILQLYSYATLLDPISLAVVNGLDVAFNAWRISAMQSPKEALKATLYFVPKGALSAFYQIGKEGYARMKYATTGKFDSKLTPEVFRYGSLTMMAELDEMMLKHKRGLQTVKEGAAARAMSLAARANMMGGRLGDMAARVTTFESTRLHLIHLGVDPDKAGWLAADETAWLHGTAGPLGDAAKLYSSTFLRLTIRHLTTYMRMRIGQEIMFGKTALVRTQRERKYVPSLYGKEGQNFLENPADVGEYGQLGMVKLPNQSEMAAPRTAEEQEAEMYHGMRPLLGGPLVRPSDAAIWAARRQLILGNAAALTALSTMTYGLGWSLWKALFIPSKIGLAAFAGISQVVEHLSLASKKAITSAFPGQDFDWTKANQSRLDYLNDRLTDYIPFYGPTAKSIERNWENGLRRKGIDPNKTPYGRAKAREKRLRNLRKRQEENRNRGR